MGEGETPSRQPTGRRRYGVSREKIVKAGL